MTGPDPAFLLLRGKSCGGQASFEEQLGLRGFRSRGQRFLSVSNAVKEVVDGRSETECLGGSGPPERLR